MTPTAIEAGLKWRVDPLRIEILAEAMGVPVKQLEFLEDEEDAGRVLVFWGSDDDYEV